MIHVCTKLMWPKSSLLLNFILNSKICNTCFFLERFIWWWWILKSVYLILKTFFKERRDLYLFPSAHSLRQMFLVSAWLLTAQMPILLKWKDHQHTNLVVLQWIIWYLFHPNSFRMESFATPFFIKITLLNICHILISRETISMITFLI